MTFDEREKNIIPYIQIKFFQIHNKNVAKMFWKIIGTRKKSPILNVNYMKETWSVSIAKTKLKLNLVSYQSNSATKLSNSPWFFQHNRIVECMLSCHMNHVCECAYGCGFHFILTRSKEDFDVLYKLDDGKPSTFAAVSFTSRGNTILICFSKNRA